MIENKKIELIRNELEEFNELFIGLLKKHVFDGFIQKLEECCTRNENKREQRPVLLKLCGSLTDVRLMLETACDELELKCVFAEENLDPLLLLGRVEISESTHLIYIQDNASLSYLNRLLETFYTSKHPAFAIIAVRSNDSHVIRLNPSLAASVPVEFAVFDDPEPLFDRMMNDFVLDYTRQSGLFLSGDLLKKLKESFIEEKQSFVELQNIIGVSISKYGSTQEFDNKLNRQKKLLPSFETYWLLLELFLKLLGNDFSLEEREFPKILDIHTEIQLDANWYGKAFEKAKSYWKGASKASFEKFIDSYIESATEFKKNCVNDRKLKDVLLKLNEIKELISRSEILSAEEKRKKDMKLSPSRRMGSRDDPAVLNILNALNNLFCNLKPITTNSVPYAPIVNECEDDEGQMVTDEAQELINKTVFF